MGGLPQWVTQTSRQPPSTRQGPRTAASLQAHAGTLLACPACLPFLGPLTSPREHARHPVDQPRLIRHKHGQRVLALALGQRLRLVGVHIAPLLQAGQSAVRLCHVGNAPAGLGFRPAVRPAAGGLCLTALATACCSRWHAARIPHLCKLPQASRSSEMAHPPSKPKGAPPPSRWRRTAGAPAAPLPPPALLWPPPAGTMALVDGPCLRWGQPGATWRNWQQLLGNHDRNLRAYLQHPTLLASCRTAAAGPRAQRRERGARQGACLPTLGRWACGEKGAVNEPQLRVWKPQQLPIARTPTHNVSSMHYCRSLPKLCSIVPCGGS